MEFFDMTKSRHSIRAYKNKPVEDEKIKTILESVNLSPSAGNLQAYEIFLIKNEEKKQAIARACNEQDFIAEAPVVLIFCANPRRSSWKYGRRGEDLYCIQDATIAASYCQLAAKALGLDSVWVGAFNEEKILKILDVKNLKPIAVIPIGYKNERPESRERRDLRDLVHYI